MVAFHPDASCFYMGISHRLSGLEPKALKFSEELSHRDYLGALLNLGVDRSVIGRDVATEKAAWFLQNKMTNSFLKICAGSVIPIF